MSDRVRFAFDSQRRPLTLIMFDEDGTEHYWKLDRTLPAGTVSLTDVAQFDAVTAVQGRCVWLCETGYRTGRCGRGGYDGGYGMTLCWQHQDALLRHILHRLQNKHFPPGHLKAFAEALAKAPYLRGPYSTASPTQKMLEDALHRNLEQVLDDQAVVSERVQVLIDRLIDRRLAERLGSPTHDEEEDDCDDDQ